MKCSVSLWPKSCSYTAVSFVLVLSILWCIPGRAVAQILPLTDRLFEYKWRAGQKVVRLSAGLVAESSLQAEILHRAYYNRAMEGRLPRNQALKRVTWRFNTLSPPGELPLIDDGLHCDVSKSDSIYGNYRVLREAELNAEEFDIDVEQDSLGLDIVALYPPVLFIPAAPHILDPLRGAQIFRPPVTVTWQLDHKADGGVLCLVDGQFTVLGPLGRVLWETERKQPFPGVLVDTIAAPLEQGRTYSLVAWSYYQARAANGSLISNESYSLESSTFVFSHEDSPRTDKLKIRSIFPNPFRDMVMVFWSQPDPGLVALSVHDILGKEVRILMSGSQDAGDHSVIWDGLDQSGERVSSGVYFVSLQGRNGRMTTKVVALH